MKLLFFALFLTVAVATCVGILLAVIGLAYLYGWWTRPE